MNIIFKQHVNYYNVLKYLKNNFEEIEIINLDAIYALILKSKHKNLLEKAYSCIQDKFSDLLESSERDSRLKYIESLINNKNVQKINSYTYYKSVDKKINSNNQIEKYSWDIDKVTNNRKTYFIEKGNHSIVIAIIDSGIDISHPDLKENIIKGKSYISNDLSLKDNSGHGTMVAGIIAANGTMKGISPRIAIKPYKVFDSNNNCNSEDVICSIVDAVKDKVDIINLSLGTYKSIIKDREFALIIAYMRSISYAYENGCIVVASAGSELKGYDISNSIELAAQKGIAEDIEIHLPGGLPNVITVASVDKYDRFQQFSNYGTNIDICAPTGSLRFIDKEKKLIDKQYLILTTIPLNLYKAQKNEGYILTYGGTSLSTAIVSATIALIICKYQRKYGRKPVVSEIKKYLYSGAIYNKDMNPIYFGNGIVNAYNSLRLI